MDLLNLQSDPGAFQQDICIATGSGPRRLGDCMADFQRERFAAVNPSLLAVARHEPPPIPRVWDERTKGASKDTDWTISLLWLLAFSRRPLRMQVGAFDSEQADEVRLIVKDILRTDGPINAFLRQVIEPQADKIINPRTGSVVEILTSDQYGSHGARIDLLLMSELTHQPSSGFAETLFDNLDKMPNALGVVITNSGHDPSWQLEWKRTFAASARWLMLEHDRPAPWVSPEALAESEKRNPPGRFNRLWHGVWSGAEGAPAISQADLAAAFDPTLRPMTGAVPDMEFVAGLDLGVSRNWSALCILGIKRSHDGHGQVRLAFTRTWKPRAGQRVNLLEIESTLLDVDARFNLRELCYDPWQCLHMVQRLQAAGLGRIVTGRNQRTTQMRLVEAPPTQVVLQRIATAVTEGFADRRITLFDNDDLRRDLTLMQLEERPNGSFRLVSPVTSDGSHGDLGTAFSLAMLAASELAGKRIITAGVVDDGDSGEPRWSRLARERRENLETHERLIASLGEDHGRREWEKIMRRVGRL